MNKPSPSLYETIAQQHVSRFNGTYDGSVNAAVLVVSSCELGDAPKAALTASFRALGYGGAGIGWAQCGTGAKGGAPAGQVASEHEEAAGSKAACAAGNASCETRAPKAAGAAHGGGAEANDVNAAPSGAQTEEGDLFDLVEAICPLCVVSTDQQAATELSHDFNTPLPLETRTLLLGHACICFRDFGSLLSSDEGKHKAWGLLKTLPKMP